jgi:hypothetical protein
MKRIAFVGLLAVIVVGAFATLASAQSDSLGDYARSIRKTDTPSTVKKYDNDNLPTNETLSIVGNPSDTSQAGDANSTNPRSSSNSAAAAAPTAQDQPKSSDEWKDKLSGQKDQVDLLTRELDVAQREAHLHAAAFYADAGARLRDSGDWDKQQTHTKEEIEQKQKALDEAKQKLDEIQENARKAGLPSGDRE